MELSFEELEKMVLRDTGIRRRQRLQPAAGEGEKIFPPTYAARDEDAPPTQCYERRLIKGRGELHCCLLDSIPSQANKMENRLQAAIAEGEIALPHFVIDFSGTGVEPQSLSSLEVPHRVFDGYIRDTFLE
jgi:CRISPR-associated protein Csb1